MRLELMNFMSGKMKPWSSFFKNPISYKSLQFWTYPAEEVEMGFNVGFT